MVAGARVLELKHTHTQPGFPGVVDEEKRREKGGGRGTGAAGMNRESSPIPRTLPIVTRNQEVSKEQMLPRETSA